MSRERCAAHHGVETLKYRFDGELEGCRSKVHEGRSSVWALCFGIERIEFAPWGKESLGEDEAQEGNRGCEG